MNERINYFIKNPIKFKNYYIEKIASTWLNPTFQTIWCSLPGTRYIWYPDYAHYLGYHEKILSMVGGDLYKIEEFYFDIYQIIAFFFAGIGILKISNKSNEINDEENKNDNSDNNKEYINPINYYILPITFLGGFLFHILWETKAIYVIQYYFILLPFTSYGLNYSYEYILNKYKSIKSKNDDKKEAKLLENKSN